MASYDEAVSALYQAPLASFVTERQRLSAELKAGGNKLAAARVAKLARPTITAWAVNQLFWHARDTFDALFATAAQLRAGKLATRAEHSKTLAKLTTRAQALLTEGGHAATEATMRRINMTLAALAAAGGFEPDPPGALSKDRDPPGFEAFGSASSSDDAEPEAAAPAPAPPTSHRAAEAERRASTEAKRRAAAEAERAHQAALAEKKRMAEERARRQAERRELEAALRSAKTELSAREHERDRIAKELSTAEHAVEHARAAVDTAEARVAALSEED